LAGTRKLTPALTKIGCNPIIAPIPGHRWESRQTFNAAAFQLEGKVHLLYRAVGDDWVSRLGYAVSSDGISIEERLPQPVYTCNPIEDEMSRPLPGDVPNLSSGGMHIGCEDPRVTAIGDMIYMLFVAFDGYNIPRLALTSIKQADFLARRWRWAQARIISKPGVIDKSGALLPEKIDGKFVLFHRIFPDILIDFLDTLDFPGGKYLDGRYSIRVRPDKWDSRKIGAGPPPIKTRYGWLLIYYAVDDRDEHKYKIGAMLLDLKDPRMVLRRSSGPVLEPSAGYENNGHKSGVAYPCGAAVIGSRLFVYYGGADSVVCVATANLSRLLHNLLKEPAE
jgi:beta-1,2-mannobiose phosphorylase / 1,2-beta-oligomannan phosphorylase